MEVLPPCDCALIPSLTSGFHSIYRAPVFFNAQPEQPEHPLWISESRRTLSHLSKAAYKRREPCTWLFAAWRVDCALATQFQTDAGQTELVRSDHQAQFVFCSPSLPLLILQRSQIVHSHDLKLLTAVLNISSTAPC